ncbi:hypothetical protein HDU93_004171 [Gonapodya sp. JEL0774]|nr:hypothetical protein HDU93_004171 [Gonapodya sp. JEL0774]
MIKSMHSGLPEILDWQKSPAFLYDPKTGHVSDHPPLLERASGTERTDESGGKWTLVEGTPSACVNIALNHLWDASTVDLVVSGPNFGRNSGSAMCFSSGTVGAALEAALLSKRAISLSIAFYSREFPPASVACAVETAADVVGKLWEMWPEGDKRVDLFNVNIPLTPTPPKIHLTRMSRGRYTSLYKPIAPAAVTMDTAETAPGNGGGTGAGSGSSEIGPLTFRWQPTFRPGLLIDDERGTDNEAVGKGRGAGEKGAEGGGMERLKQVFPPMG